MKIHNPAHPGLLIKEYIDGFESNITIFAQRLGVTRVALSRIVNQKASISPEMAVRLSKLLPNTTPDFWLKLQAQYDVWQLEQTHSLDIAPFMPIPVSVKENALIN